MTTKIAFETLIDDSLSNISTLDQFKSVLNKKIVSVINEFEDGAWRYSKFQHYLWDNIVQTALSQRERAALVGKGHTALVEAAKNLRLTDKDELGQGSEIAEIFLYGVMKDHFGALPVVPKIFYKQNNQDNAKGADSVHIVIKDDDFTLWFGEAKFYNSIADGRLDSIVKSVLETLGTDKLKKENSIVTNVSDILHLPIPSDLKERIISSIRPRESIDNIKSKINVPIMVLHECEITASHAEMSMRYRESIGEHHTQRAEAYFAKQMTRSSSVFKYSEIVFHLILFPVPNKSKIVKAFIEGVQFYKGQQ
ncbi:hypothetical protein FHS21_006228 [Phyllobacterium trifolii]|uniref:Anti-bacteriophage protein A/HamA C-terminal domain-containing protein n=1 Tax=Phyllobacterium trifolii TaxID=300193 RepID=A0A839UJ21_9HYPH|nr:DUF1837 domain-containing protein [Phyllobacterium trifolii]MBB3149774.1 hypothetical protein [Phyllobacterium trifolii]